MHYYMPSLAVSKRGDILVGFSGSSINQNVGAYYTGTLANGTMPNSPIRYFSGIEGFDNQARWGDFSGTVLDPDGMTFWTIQEYSEMRPPNVTGNIWGTRIGVVTP